MVLHPNNKELQSQVIKRIGKMCFQEIKHLCSDNYDSILRTTSDVPMTHFSWESIWIEISTKAPTLVSILKSCLPVKTKLNRKPVLCLCVSMLLKLRNRKMCHVPISHFPYCTCWACRFNGQSLSSLLLIFIFMLYYLGT